MAKYVCEFDQVRSVGEKLCTTAANMQTAVSSFSSTIQSDLSSWTGSAKGSFDTQCTGQVEIANQNAQKIKAAGEFIKNAVNAIEQLEGELSSLKI